MKYKIGLVLFCLIMVLSGCSADDNGGLQAGIGETGDSGGLQAGTGETDVSGGLQAGIGETVENGKPQASGGGADGSQIPAEAEVVYSDEPLSFSAESGVYAQEFSLEIKGGGRIYYTLDGSDPTESQTRLIYTGQVKITSRKGAENVIAAVDPSLFSGNYCEFSYGDMDFTYKVKAPGNDAVDKCTVVRAALQKQDGTYAETASGVYYIGTAEEHIQGLVKSVEASGEKLAVISISIDYEDLFDPATGIYAKGDYFDKALQAKIKNRERIDNDALRKMDANYNQRGREWERRCHMDFFEFDADGAKCVMSQDCGIRIQGKYSRSDLQKGFRLYAREEYGEKRFDYDVFGDKTEVDSFKTLMLRAGGNCAFTSKFNDTYWQTVFRGMDCSTQTSRPCVVYMNGEYFGLYVLQEDYSEHYFADHYGVSADDVVVYKGDAETIACGYYLDEGKLPEGVTDEGYYFEELMAFFGSHSDLADEESYAEFEKLVDVESVRDYFLAQIWINNKWDWPGKNWAMWRTAGTDGETYGDGRWRCIFYDVDFGGISGAWDVPTNTVKEDNYKPKGLLDKNTNNPLVLCFAYLMTNDGFREDFCSRLKGLSDTTFQKDRLNALLDDYENQYSPLYGQFFKRYPGAGNSNDALYGGYASIKCLRDFIDGRANYIGAIVLWIKENS